MTRCHCISYETCIIWKKRVIITGCSEVLWVRQRVSTKFQNTLRAVGSKVVKNMGSKVKA